MNQKRVRSTTVSFAWLLFAGVAMTLAACGSHTALPPTPNAGSFAPKASRATFGTHAVSSPSLVWGTLVDDATGAALGGVPVHLLPWSPGCKVIAHTHPQRMTCPPYLPEKTRTRGDGRFYLRGVPAGHYLLVIGSDRADVENAPGNLKDRPTIHDDICVGGTLDPQGPGPWQTPGPPWHPKKPDQVCVPTKVGRSQELLAPSWQPRALWRYMRAPETTHDYRLKTFGKQEMAWVTCSNAMRAKVHQAGYVPDEWMSEDNWLDAKFDATNRPKQLAMAKNAGDSYSDGSSSGYISCPPVGTPNPPWYYPSPTRSPLYLWAGYGAYPYPYHRPGTPIGGVEWQTMLIDPRVIESPGGPWI